MYQLKIRGQASSGLTDEEIDKMKKEAEANAEADKSAKEKVDKINAADSMIFQTEKQLSEYGDKLSEDNKAKINAALENLKTAHKEQNVEGIDPAINALNEAWQGASQEMYKDAQPGAEGPAAGAADADGSDDTVSDVEYEEVDDSKKD